MGNSSIISGVITEYFDCSVREENVAEVGFKESVSISSTIAFNIEMSKHYLSMSNNNTGTGSSSDEGVPATTDNAGTTPITRRSLLGSLAGAGISVTALSEKIKAAQTRTSPIKNDDQQPKHVITSPDRTIRTTVDIRDGIPKYSVAKNGTPIIEPSTLGFDFQDAPALAGEFSVTGAKRESVDTTWEPVWDRYEEIRNHYEELVVGLEETTSSSRALTLSFRVFNDGIAFRYTIPEQDSMDEFTITSENTQFNFAGNYTTWWIPQSYDSYEMLYNETPLSDVCGANITDPMEGHSEGPSRPPSRGANTPVTMEVADDLYVSLHEANLTDYAGMTMTPQSGEDTHMKSTIVPLPDGTKVKASAPHPTPWRTLTIGNDPGDLIESNILLNLNDPPAEIYEDNTDWIDPQKYMGIWWEIHIGQSTWIDGPDHGATTENTKRYMDFCSQHSIPSLLTEGWNVGWQGGWGEQDFDQPYDNFDLETIAEYGLNLDPKVRWMAHNETGGLAADYETQLDEAYSLYQEVGSHALKTGYAGDVPDHYHHDQWMVNHYQYVVETAAEYELMINAHEPIKPTGKRRTYPNFMTREGVRGMEYNAWSEEGNPPDHTVTLPFTRMLAGPLDYTPGIFNIDFEDRGGSGNSTDQVPGNQRVHSTRARQLALYPILFSGLQMVADLPDHYTNDAGEPFPEFTFIEHVPAAWHDTVVVNAEIGDYITVARRKDDEWYIGSGTDETARVLDISLEFLSDSERESSRPYVAHVYTDGSDADLETNPTPVAIDKVIVDPSDTIVASMEPGGGQAIRLTPVSSEEAEKVDEYEPPEQEYTELQVPNTVDSDEAFITVVGTNAGTVIGGETVTVYVDGEETDTELVRLAPGEDTYTFDTTLSESGTYEVTIGPSMETTLPPQTVIVK